MSEDGTLRDLDDILEDFWDEVEPEDWEVASFRSDYGTTIIGVAEVDGWLIPYKAGDDSGTLGAWRHDEPGASDAALKACRHECGASLGFAIGTELRELEERDGAAPWMTGTLAELLVGYAPDALAEALKYQVTSVPEPPRLISRLQSGRPPETEEERSFAWDLTTALGMAEHQGRRLGE